jgi:hypothetical protein
VEKKTVIIEVQTDSGVKELDRLSAKFDEVYGEVLPLTAAIGELEDQLYEMARRGEQNSDAFRELSAEAGKLKKTIQQVDLEVDALSMTTANKLGGSLQGVASGFELAQGAMGAMGVESEHVQEALLKVQSAMAMAQGLQGLKESLPALKSVANVAVKAFSTVKGAVMATGIGLLAVAVGLVVANLDKIKGVASSAKSSISDYLNSGTTGAKVLKAYLDALILPITLAIKAYNNIKDAIMGTSDATRAVAANQEKVHKQRLNQIDEERNAQKELLTGLDQKIALLEAEGKSTIELRKQKIALQKADIEGTIAALEYLTTIVKKDSILGKVYSDMLDNSKATLNSIKIEEAKLKNETISNQREQNENAKAAAKERSDLLDAEMEKKWEAAQEEVELQQFLTDSVVAEEQARTDAKKAQQDKENEDAQAAAEFRAEITAWELQQAIDADKQKEATRLASIEKWKGMEAGAFQFINDLADLFTGKSEASQKRAFKIKKAASLAQATIDTIQSTQAAFASQVIPGDPTSVIRGVIAATFAATSGLARIKQIAQTKFEGGGAGASSGGGGGSAPSVQSTPAQFNIVGNSNTNQLVEGLAGNPLKAFVVAGDVSTAQSLDRNKIQTASI